MHFRVLVLFKRIHILEHMLYFIRNLRQDSNRLAFSRGDFFIFCNHLPYSQRAGDDMEMHMYLRRMLAVVLNEDAVFFRELCNPPYHLQR